MSDLPYVYIWGNNSKRATLKGRRCKVLQRLALNSCIVEFENGQREVISRNALRRIEGIAVDVMDTVSIRLI
jgi:hypothetical protein